MTACGGTPYGDTLIVPELSNLTVSAGVDPKTLYFEWDVDQGDDVDHYRLDVDPDGTSGFNAVAGAMEIATTDSRVTIPVNLTDWINALFRVVALDDQGNELAASGEIDLFNHVIAEEAIGYFKAGNTEANDEFSHGVALSADGDTLAVGAYHEASAATGINGNPNDNRAEDAGAVYLFTRDDAGIWSRQAYIKASNTDAGDWFGCSVALSANGDTLAVGANREDSAATGIGGDQDDNSADQAGAVYLFTRDGTGDWSQQAYIKASNTDAGDRFGCSVALSANGGTLAVGAYAEESAATGIGGDQDDNSAFHAGAVYLFTRDGTDDWSQQAYVKASNTEFFDLFGEEVVLSADGDTLAVGAYYEKSEANGIGGDQDDNSADGAGAVYLFTRDGSGDWSQQAYIRASNTDAVDVFGRSVALSADGDRGHLKKMVPIPASTGTAMTTRLWDPALFICIR